MAQVTIQDGSLKGTTGTNLDGEEFFQFFGIPYAKPPINELRFMPPQPVDPWKGVKDATIVGSASISRDELTSQIVGSEDCLNLNVYTKELPNSETELKPVMIYIHGGAFNTGSNRPGLYGPEFLLTKNIVLVTINYRLGVLGFLSIDGTPVTGNMGLKDQNLALKWVRRNIKHFNGDPNNVTIFGHSAGSASVHAHILSPASKGLFQKAILQSGNVLNSWCWGSKNNATKLVELLGKSADTEKQALEILKQVPAMDIHDAQLLLGDAIYASEKRPFSVVIESPNETAFITKDLRELIKEGNYNDLPIMIGYTDKEGMVLETAKTYNVELPPFKMENIIPAELNLLEGSADSQKVVKILEGIYSKQPNDEHYDELTDTSFLVGICEFLLNHLKNKKLPTFLYRMTISSNVNYLKNMLHKTHLPGACHADDLGYLFKSDITPEITPGSLEDKFIRIFVELWTNFATFGNPTANSKLNVSWEPLVRDGSLKLLNIGKELEFIDMPGSERKRVDTWMDIYNKWQPEKRS
ncbi:unnamed protein product [Ceutorhynchus assimilis]|uniref:Carboxylesterase type B domain-containing protein n=1 Tax=Ceutorhynchus assimilis TaxID=467358 RepID=A0A9N9MMK9_9CUCU|nr:unnamed protein product [Ceutorhynchus assimilis]